MEVQFGAEGSRRLVLDWKQGEGASAVTGALFHTALHAECLGAGAYGAYAGLCNAGRAAPVGAAGAAGAAGGYGLAAEFCGAARDVTLLPARNPAALERRFADGEKSYHLTYVPITAGAVNTASGHATNARARYAAVVKALAAEPVTPGYVGRAAAIIAGPPVEGGRRNVTESAEYAALLLYAVAQPEVPARVRQDVVWYAREILRGVNKLLQDEDQVCAGLLRGLEQLLGAERLGALREALGRRGLHVSHYGGEDAATERAWVAGCELRAAQLVLNNEGRCALCRERSGAEYVDELATQYSAADGALLDTPDPALTVRQVVLTAALAPQGCFGHYVRGPWAAEIARAARECWAEGPPRNERGFVALEAAEAWGGRYPELWGRFAAERWLPGVQGRRKHALVGEWGPQRGAAHVRECHAGELALPPELPGLAELLREVLPGPEEEERRRGAAGLLRGAAPYVDPVSRYSVLVPAYWVAGGAVSRMQEFRALREARRASLLGSRALLQCALDHFYGQSGYDGMEAFIQNTAILSGETPLRAVVPAMPVRPHAFQRAYLDQMLRRVQEDVAGAQGGPPAAEEGGDEAEAEDPEVVVDVGVLLQELELREYEGLVRVPLEEGEGWADGALARYVSWLCALELYGGRDVRGGLFRYVRGLSASYRRAALTVKNAEVVWQVGAAGLLLLRGDPPRAPLSEGQLAYLGGAVERGLKSGEVEEALAENLREAGVPRSVPGSPAAGEGSFVEEGAGSAEQMVSRDYRCLRRVLPREERVLIARNTGDIEFTVNDNIAGAGKTTMALMAAALLHKVKQLLGAGLPLHLEMVLVCDQLLVRRAAYDAAYALGNTRINATLIEQGQDPESNFVLQGGGGRPGRAAPAAPGFKCGPVRDLVIMSSQFLVPYVLGRRDGGTVGRGEGGWYGNPHAYVFIDEFGAKLGNIEAVRALEGARNMHGLLEAVKQYAPAMLVLTNAPRLLTITGATVVPRRFMADTIAEFCDGRSAGAQQAAPPGEIYVGSQFYAADGGLLHLWSVCPRELFPNFFIGLERPLIRRTVGHRAATHLREQIRRAAAQHPRLREMQEYLEYDLGTYTGDSVADYATGLLYFMHLYALRYLGPAPGLGLRCADMAPLLERGPHPPRLPADAPWPRSHFVLPHDIYRALPAPGAGPAGPGFLECVGVRAEWRGEVHPHARLLARAPHVAAALRGPAAAPGHPAAPLLMGALQEAGRAADWSAPPEWGALLPERRFSALPWTTFGRAVAALRSAGLDRSDNRVRFVLDSRPGEFARRLVAAAERIPLEELPRRAEEAMKRGLEYKQRQDARLGRVQQRLDAARTRAQKRQVMDSAGNVYKERVDTAAYQEGNDEGSGDDPRNPVTRNPYYCEDEVAGSGAVEAYLLSWGVLVLSSEMEEQRLARIYRYLDELRTHRRILMVVVDSVGAYGLNVSRATVAMSTPRVAMGVSHQTLLQFYCRAGRRGLSDDASLYVDQLTLVRLLEASVHHTDAALFPNVAAALEDAMSEAEAWRGWVARTASECAGAHAAAVEALEAGVRAAAGGAPPGCGGLLQGEGGRWLWAALLPEAAHPPLHELEARCTTEPDAVARRALCALLLPRLLRKGQQVRDCELLSFLVGALQLHIHEPFGVQERPLRPTWPRQEGGPEELETLAHTLHAVTLAFSQARDLSSYKLYEKFLALRAADSSNAASALISTIAHETVKSLNKKAASSMRAGADNRLDVN